MYKVCEGRQSSPRWNASTTSCSNGKQSPICKKKPQFTRKSSSKKSSFIKLVLVNADKKSPSVPEKREKRGLGITKYMNKKLSSPVSRVISPDPGIYADVTKEEMPVSEVILPQVTDGDASGDASKSDQTPEIEFQTESEQRRNQNDSQETLDGSNFPIKRFSPRSASPYREESRNLGSRKSSPQEKKGIRKKSSILLNKIASRAPSVANLSKAVCSDTHNYIPTILCVVLFLIGLVLNIYFMLMFIPIFAGMLLLCPRDNPDRPQTHS